MGPALHRDHSRCAYSHQLVNETLHSMPELKTHNNRMHSDSKKRRSSFLVALRFAAGDARR